MLQRALTTLLAVLLVAALNACGSAPQKEGDDENVSADTKPAEPKPSTARASVCAMIPKAEMEAILGGSLATAEAKDVPGKTQCIYAGFGGRFADVAIEWGNGEAGMAGARLAAKLMGATAGTVQVMTPIEGLGDEATMMIGGVLSVRKGGDLITVDLRTNKNAEVTGPDIARKLIARM